MNRIRFSVLLCMALSLAGCRPSSSPALHSGVQTMQNVSIDSGFDTVITLIEQTDDPDGFAGHFNEMCDTFRRYNALFDIYNDYEGVNNVKTINDQAGKEPVKADPELIALLKKAEYFYELSDGAFDITMGALLNVWHEYRTAGLTENENGRRAPLPSQQELEEAGSHHGFDALVIDEKNSTVYISDPDVRLDVGGIAKGFATEQAARMLEEQGVSHAAINAGGNNRTMGSKIDGSAWNVGIQHPDAQGSLIVVQIEGSDSFVTSGDYERFYIAEDGRRYQHIVDPFTFYPSDRYRSVTIITPDSGDADCLSTTLTVCSIEEGRRILEEYRSDTGNNAEAIWILAKDKAEDDAHSHMLADYQVICTEGLEGRIIWNP